MPNNGRQLRGVVAVATADESSYSVGLIGVSSISSSAADDVATTSSSGLDTVDASAQVTLLDPVRPSAAATDEPPATSVVVGGCNSTCKTARGPASFLVTELVAAVACAGAANAGDASKR